MAFLLVSLSSSVMSKKSEFAVTRGGGLVLFLGEPSFDGPSDFTSPESCLLSLSYSDPTSSSSSSSSFDSKCPTPEFSGGPDSGFALSCNLDFSTLPSEEAAKLGRLVAVSYIGVRQSSDSSMCCLLAS